jgi:hypothetical protein
MEADILRVLSYNLTAATPVTFLQRLASQLEMDDELSHLSMYLAEITIQELSYTKYPPSHIAISAAMLAYWTKGQPFISIISPFFKAWGLSVVQVRPCVLDMHQTHVRIHDQSRSLQASLVKFSTPRFQGVSWLQPNPTPPDLEAFDSCWQD